MSLASLTVVVPHGKFGDTTALRVDPRAAGKQRCDSLKESILASQVKWSVSVAVTDQRVPIGLKQVLNDLVLTSDDC